MHTYCDPHASDTDHLLAVDAKQVNRGLADRRYSEKFRRVVVPAEMIRPNALLGVKEFYFRIARLLLEADAIRFVAIAGRTG